MLESNCQIYSPEMMAQLPREVRKEEDQPLDQSQWTSFHTSAKCFTPAICLGITEEEKQRYLPTRAVPKQPILSEGSTKTLSQQDFTSDSLPELHEGSLCQNGTTSSKRRRLTSTKSSCRYTALRLIQRERLMLETLRSVSEDLKQKEG